MINYWKILARSCPYQIFKKLMSCWSITRSELDSLAFGNDEIDITLAFLVDQGLVEYFAVTEGYLVFSLSELGHTWFTRWVQELRQR